MELMEFIATLEESLGLTATKEFLPMQPGDVIATYADIEELSNDFGFRPSTTIREGIRRFIEWYLDYYGTPVDPSQPIASGNRPRCRRGLTIRKTDPVR